MRPERLRDRVTERILEVPTRAPRMTLALCVLVAGIGAAWTVLHLRVEADRNALIREGREWNERFEAYRNTFPGTQDLLVALKGGSVDVRERYADRLADSLRDVEAVESIFYRIDPEPFKARSLLYMNPEELAALEKRLIEDGESMERLVADPGLEGALRLVNRGVSNALVGEIVSGLLDAPQEEATQPHDLTFLLELLRAIEGRLSVSEGVPHYVSPWSGLLGGGARGRSGYVSSGGGRYTLLAVTPNRAQDGNVDRIVIDAIESRVAQLAGDFPEVRVGITGQRAINAAEIRATVRDTRNASLIALVGIALLFAFGFRRVSHPVFAVIALLVGIAWSAGATTIVVGRLTVLSVAFTSVLIGLGIDFGIHVVARLEDEYAAGRVTADALRRAVLGSAPGNLAGALTTSLAFFGLLLGDFQGLAELGVIAGMGVLLCLAASLLVLPALMTLFPGVRRSSKKPTPIGLRAAYARPRTLLALGVALAVAGVALAPLVRFDGNLLNLQAKGVPAVELELELLEADSQSGVFAVSIVDDLEQARRLVSALEALPEVARVSSLADLVPAQQEERRVLISALAPHAAALDVERGAPAPVAFDRVMRRVQKLRYTLRPQAADSGRLDPLQLLEARRLLDTIHERAASMNPAQHEDVAERLNVYQSILVDDLFDQLDWLKAGMEPSVFGADALPTDLRERFEGSDGRQLLRIYPADNVWEPQTRQLFLDALRSVDPNVTGVPVQMHESSTLMLRGYIEGGLYALCIVFLVLLADFRRVDHVLFAFVPLLVGAAWTLGVMALTGTDFNLANLVILPLMMGIGIDIGVHSVHRFAQDRVGGLALVTGSTGRAVLLSGLTTTVGFGALAVARHQGIASLGWLLAVGVLATVVAALAVLAPLLEIRLRASS